MKRKIMALFVSVIAVVVVSVSITVFASNTTDKKESHSDLSIPEQVNEINSYFSAMSDDPAFGGLYREGNTLIVNVTNERSIACQLSPSLSSVCPDIDIEYRYVKYSLAFLESVKDALALRMNVWGISVLDANDVTNQVDIYLKQYNDQVQSDITRFVDDSFGISDFLNFIDYSGVSIESSVGNILDEDEYFSDVDSNDNDDTLSTSSVGISSHGDQILIGSHTYTLGPAPRVTTAYTAGHDYIGQQAVYEYPNIDKQIGVVTGHFGGSSGDWGLISVSAGRVFNPTTQFQNPVVGDYVWMHGGKSGWKGGKVIGINQTVALAGPYDPLTGMCSAKYSAIKGDSGAGIFSFTSDALGPVISYGVHSSTV